MKKTRDRASRSSSSRANEHGRAQAGPNGRSLRPPRSGISVVDSEDFAGTAATSRTGAHQAIQHQIQASAGPHRVALSGAPPAAAAENTTALCQAAAEHGAQASSSGSLPHLDVIQRSFGRHNVRKIEAHVGGPGRELAQAMNARAYATKNHVVFAEAPDLHTAAHEAAHVVQQAGGVRLKSSSGTATDDLERHADDVADRVIAGQSAEDLLCAPPIASNAPSLQYKLVKINGQRFDTKSFSHDQLLRFVDDLVSSNDREAMFALADALSRDQIDSQDGETIPGARYTVNDLNPILDRLLPHASGSAASSASDVSTSSGSSSDEKEQEHKKKEHKQGGVDTNLIKEAIDTAVQEYIQRAPNDKSRALWQTWHQHTNTRFDVCNRARKILEGRGIDMGSSSAWEKALQGKCGLDTDNWTDK